MQTNVKPTNKEVKLSRRLTYLLRYGAVKEGLHVNRGGYVELPQLLALPIFGCCTEAKVMRLIGDTASLRGTPRFEVKGDAVGIGGVQVRARHGQQMQRSSHHEGTRVTRLLESCSTAIVKHIGKYDFQGFPDMYLLNAIIHKLKQAKRLNNTTLRVMLTATLEHLNLEGVLLTPNTIRIMAAQGSNLRVLSMRGAGYVMSDHLMEVLFRSLKRLQSLDISGCDGLTDRSLTALAKSNNNLMHLNASGNYNFTEKALIDFILTSKVLTHLDIYSNCNISKGGRHILVDIARERKLTVVLKGLDDKLIAPEDPATVLPVWHGQLI